MKYEKCSRHAQYIDYKIIINNDTVCLRDEIEAQKLQ